MITRMQKIVAGSAILLVAALIACFADVAFERRNPPAEPVRSETGP
jgi:hypothetical protein